MIGEPQTHLIKDNPSTKDIEVKIADENNNSNHDGNPTFGTQVKVSVADCTGTVRITRKEEDKKEDVNKKISSCSLKSQGLSVPQKLIRNDEIVPVNVKERAHGEHEGNNNNNTSDKTNANEKEEEKSALGGLQKCMEWLSHHPNGNPAIILPEHEENIDGYSKQIIKRELYHYRQKSVRDWVNTLPDNMTSKQVEESATTFAHFDDNAKIEDELLYHENGQTNPVTQKDSLSLINTDMLESKLPQTILINTPVRYTTSDVNGTESNPNNDNNNQDQDEDSTSDLDNRANVDRPNLNMNVRGRRGRKEQRRNYFIRWIVRIPLVRNCFKDRQRVSRPSGRQRTRNSERLPERPQTFSIISNVDSNGEETTRRIINIEGKNDEDVRKEVNSIIDDLLTKDLSHENSAENVGPENASSAFESAVSKEGGDKKSKLKLSGNKNKNNNNNKNSKQKAKGKKKRGKKYGKRESTSRKEDGGDDKDDGYEYYVVEKDSESNSDEIERLTSFLLKTPKSTMRTIFSLQKERIPIQTPIPPTLLQRVGQHIQSFLDRIGNLRYGSFRKRSNRVIPSAGGVAASSNNTASSAPATQQQKTNTFLGKLKKIIPNNNNSNTTNNNNNSSNDKPLSPSPVNNINQPTISLEDLTTSDESSLSNYNDNDATFHNQNTGQNPATNNSNNNNNTVVSSSIYNSTTNATTTKVTVGVSGRSESRRLNHDENPET